MFTVRLLYLIKPFTNNIKIVFQEIVNHYNNPDVFKSKFSVYIIHTLEEAVDSTRWAGAELVWWWVRSNGRVMTWFGVGCPLFTTIECANRRKQNDVKDEACEILCEYRNEDIHLPDVCAAMMLFCNSLIGAGAVLLEWSITLAPIFMPGQKNRY